jgi:hypothetical protein
MRRRKPQVDHRLVISTSLQEASTWINQARIALDKESYRLNDEEKARRAGLDSVYLEKVGRALAIIHNRYSRVKMSGD